MSERPPPPSLPPTATSRDATYQSRRHPTSCSNRHLSLTTTAKLFMN